VNNKKKEKKKKITLELGVVVCEASLGYIAISWPSWAT
jgi:hypothetical protein